MEPEGLRSTLPAASNLDVQRPLQGKCSPRFPGFKAAGVNGCASAGNFSAVNVRRPAAPALQTADRRVRRSHRLLDTAADRREL